MFTFNLFRFSKPTLKGDEFGFLKTDMHSHLIPGVDDGADSLDASLSFLRGLKEMGYEKVITTPHIRPGYFPNEEEALKRGFQILKKAVRKEGIDIELECAAEYYVDHEFEERLATVPLMTFSGNHVLIELSTIAPPPGLESIVFQMKLKGYQPILAHPERYIYFNEVEIFRHIKGYGCLMQLNLLSLTGHYGKGVKELAQKLLKAGLIDLLGTDLHHQRHLDAIKKMASSRSTLKMLSQFEFLNPTF